MTSILPVTKVHIQSVLSLPTLAVLHNYMPYYDGTYENLAQNSTIIMAVMKANKCRLFRTSVHKIPFVHPLRIE